MPDQVYACISAAGLILGVVGFVWTILTEPVSAENKVLLFLADLIGGGLLLPAVVKLGEYAILAIVGVFKATGLFG